MVGDRA